MEMGIYLMLPTEDKAATSNSDLRIKLLLSVRNGLSFQNFFVFLIFNLIGEKYIYFSQSVKRQGKWTGIFVNLRWAAASLTLKISLWLKDAGTVWCEEENMC